MVKLQLVLFLHDIQFYFNDVSSFDSNGASVTTAMVPVLRQQWCQCYD